MRYCALISRAISLASLLFIATITHAANKIVEATIAQIDERGFVLMVGTEPLPVEDQSDTHFWKAKSATTREAFKVGDAVTARIRADRTPVLVREMADRPTWEWLERIRKQPQAGIVKKLDDKYLTVQLADGSSFAYRVTAKSDVSLGGQSSPVSALREGQKVWVKGRTLPTLDTWVVHLSDQPMVVATKTPRGKRGKAPAAIRIPDTGKITGEIVRHSPQMRLFGVPVNGVTVQFGYNAETRFFLDGRLASPEIVHNGLRAVVVYRRDFVGRIIATKVELFSGTGT